MASFASTPAPSSPLLATLHTSYITNLSKSLSSASSYEGSVTAHLRMSGVYWSLATMSLLHPRASMNTQMDSPSILTWLWTCYDPNAGGFGGNAGHDAHLLYTLSALQILALTGNMADLDKEGRRAAIVKFVEGRIDAETGVVCGDKWGETDTRFSYCAAQALALLNALTPPLATVIAKYVNSCKNFDAGYGSCPGAESHAAQVFCCVGALSICGDLSEVDCYSLTFWLAERQCSGGGLNGRPEKQADVCYSWWILSALCILGKTGYVNQETLKSFILKCQDDEKGGIADRPDNVADVFHTFFGISGLGLMGFETEREVDPVYALPKDVVVELGLTAQVMKGSEAYEGYERKESMMKSLN